MRWIGYAALATLLSAGSALAETAPHERQAHAIFDRLISFRTAAGHGQVPAMANYIAETLRSGGVPAEDIVILPHEESVAMLVRVPGRDAAARPILFSGHMDVVDARPEDWERNPFQLIEEDGYFFGRGTGDNKAGITSMVSTILRLRADDHVPRRTLVFAFIGDEETDMATTRMVAAHDWVRNAEYAINTDAGGGGISESGEPQLYAVQSGEKTYASYKVTVRNPGGHSSRPRPDNAIYELSEALLRLRGYDFPVMTNALTLRYFEATGPVLPPEQAAVVRRFVANPQDPEAVAALRRSPEAGTISTTCVATMLSAGHAENALPQRAEATVNCRIFPGVTVESARSTLAEVFANPNIAIEVMGEPSASPISEPREDVMAAIARSIHRHYPGIPLTPYQESGATDGKVYRTAGIPTWATSGIFMKDSDMFFHGLNERIPVAAFYQAIGHIHDLAVDLGGR